MTTALLAAVGVLQSALPNAHAHNDYLHDRPLLDALDHGFSSVEADVFLEDGELLVAHERKDTTRERTLRKLYLEPLARRARRNNGFIHAKGMDFILLVDIKADGPAVLQVLLKQLEPLHDVLTHYSEKDAERSAVSVILSGERPIADVKALRSGGKAVPLAIDGRLTDLEGKVPATLMPLVSQGWSARFKWKGEGAMPVDESTRLRQLTTKAHAQGRKIRFWATPDKPSAWAELRDAKVDLINTDDLPGLSRFLRSRR